MTLLNLWTHEELPVPGTVEAERFDALARCHYTNQATHMDPRLIDVLTRVAGKFSARRIEVVSGYRSPKYNLMLRKKGHQVARDSQHTHGNAVDFFIPHVTTQQLQAWAKAQKLGGVGIYLESGFVHMDTGPIRFWSGD